MSKRRLPRETHVEFEARYLVFQTKYDELMRLSMEADRAGRTSESQRLWHMAKDLEKEKIEYDAALVAENIRETTESQREIVGKERWRAFALYMSRKVWLLIWGAMLIVVVVLTRDRTMDGPWVLLRALLLFVGVLMLTKWVVAAIHGLTFTRHNSQVIPNSLFILQIIESVWLWGVLIGSIALAIWWPFT
jgi:hypothetical protein